MMRAALADPIQGLTMCHTREECRSAAIQLFRIANEAARDAILWRRRGQRLLAVTLAGEARLMRFLARGVLERRCPDA